MSGSFDVVAVGGDLDVARTDTYRRPPSGSLSNILFASTLVLFIAVADHTLARGFLAPLVGLDWLPGDDPATPSGRFLIDGMYRLVRMIPRSGPELLVICTCLLTAAGVTRFGVSLRRRGWSPIWATLATAAVALHPVTLYLATTGQPAVLSMAAIAVVVLSVDRAGALGDAQSLMGLGLAFALLLITDANAIYLILPALCILPLTLTAMRDPGSASALLLIVLVPAAIAFAALMLRAVTMGVGVGEAMTHWMAALHGRDVAEFVESPWVARNGGTFLDPFGDLLLLCLACSPQVLVVTVRVFRRRRRVRVGTAMLALLLAPVAAALALYFWHPEPWWDTAATALVAASAWILTVPMGRTDRQLWLFAGAAGVAFAWFGPWLWHDPQHIAWRAALFG
jgi:membrane protein YdbS with pleckstrin-like domain